MLPPETNTAKENRYRQENLFLEWNKIMPALLRVHYEYRAPATTTCFLCQAIEENVVWCRDCGPMAYMCHVCSQKIHKVAILHKPYQWQGNLFVEFEHQKLLKTPHQRTCSESCPVSVTVVDMSARQHTVDVFSCQHENLTSVLVGSCLWPTTPTHPRSALDMRLLQLYSSMLLEAQLPKNAFCRSMAHFKQKHDNGADYVNMYRILCGESGNQYIRFSNSVEKLAVLCDNNTVLDETQCPICISTPTIPKVFSLDGNFRLVRRKNAGESPYQPFHKDKFFLSDNNAEGEADVHIQECNNFKAGILASKKKNHLDMTGVFGSVCIHNFPRYFINMTSGESLYLPANVLEKLRSDFTGSINILYDVACRFQPFVEKRDSNLLKDVSLAVPLFHGFAHIPKCQVTYNPRRKTGFRMADGENIERFWSYMDNFGRISRCMTASHRHDLLVEAFLHHGRKVVAKAPFTIRDRVKRSRGLIEEANDALASISQEIPGTTEQTILLWAQNEEMVANQRPLTRQNKEFGSWQEEYAAELHKWFELRAKNIDDPVHETDMNVNLEMNKVEKKLQKMERQHKISRWLKESEDFQRKLTEARASKQRAIIRQMHDESVQRKYLLHYKDKSTSSVQAERFIRAIQGNSQRLDKLVASHNLLPGIEKIDVKDAKDCNGPIYSGIEEDVAASEIPYHLIRKGIDNLMLKQRAQEEIAAAQVELEALVKYYASPATSLRQLLSELEHVGLKTAVLSKILHIESYQKCVAGVLQELFQIQVDVDTQTWDSVLGTESSLFHPPEVIDDVTEEDYLSDHSDVEELYVPVDHDYLIDN